MDKKQMLKTAFALIAVATLIYELFAFGFFNGSGRNSIDVPTQPGDTTQVHGAAEFQVLLLNYEPYLVVDKLNESQIVLIKKNVKVEDITDDKQGTIVVVKNNEDVAEVSTYLAGLGIKNIAIANVQFPGDIFINGSDGRVIDASVPQGASVKYPLTIATIPLNTFLKAKMVAIVQNSVLTGYEPNSFSLISDTVKQNTTAQIKGRIDTIYTFEVPFSKRNEIDEEKLKKDLNDTDIRYVRADYVDFGVPLSLNETTEKKNIGYVTYINEGTISVNKSFMDSDRILSDFFNHSASFPPSLLYVKTNESFELHYNKTAIYEYSVELPENIGNYTNYNKIMIAKSEKEYDENSTVNVSIKANAMGTIITDIVEAKISN